MSKKEQWSTLLYHYYYYNIFYSDPSQGYGHGSQPFSESVALYCKSPALLSTVELSLVPLAYSELIEQI